MNPDHNLVSEDTSSVLLNLRSISPNFKVRHSVTDERNRTVSFIHSC